MDKESSQLAIRQMVEEDAEAISRMMASLAAHHGDSPNVNAADFIKHCIGEGKLATVWIAESDRFPAGFAATYDWMNFVRGCAVRHIDLLFVEEEFRHKGIAKALIRALTRDAKASGCRRVTVGAATQNEAANNFYRVLGFEPRVDTSTRYQLSGDALDHLDCA